jgi:hypothetical protein
MDDQPNNGMNPTPSESPTPPSPSPNTTPRTPLGSASDQGQNTPPVQHEPTTPLLTPETPKKKRKGLIIGSIIAGALVILGGGGVFAYNWYQNPEKVVTDAIVNAIKAKTATYTGSFVSEGSLKLKVELTGKNDASTSDMVARVTFPMGDMDHTVEAAARFDKNGDLFLKLKELDTLLDAYRAEIPPESMQTVDAFIAKVNDRWVKISADDLAEFDQETSKKQKCATEAFKKYYQDDKMIGEVADVYKKHKFIKIEQNLGAKEGSMGYTLKADEKVSKDFFKGLKDTSIYKELNKCDPEFKLDEEEAANQTNESESATTGTVELWVHQWSHQVTEVKITSKEKETENKAEAILRPKFNEKITVETPKDSISLKQLQKEIEELWATAQAQAEQQAMAQEEAYMMQEFDTSSEL